MLKKLIIASAFFALTACNSQQPSKQPSRSSNVVYQSTNNFHNNGSNPQSSSLSGLSKSGDQLDPVARMFYDQYMSQANIAHTQMLESQNQNNRARNSINYQMPTPYVPQYYPMPSPYVTPYVTQYY